MHMICLALWYTVTALNRLIFSFLNETIYKVLCKKPSDKWLNIQLNHSDQTLNKSTIAVNVHLIEFCSLFSMVR